MRAFLDLYYNFVPRLYWRSLRYSPTHFRCFLNFPGREYVDGDYQLSTNDIITSLPDLRRFQNQSSKIDTVVESGINTTDRKASI